MALPINTDPPAPAQGQPVTTTASPAPVFQPAITPAPAPAIQPVETKEQVDMGGPPPVYEAKGFPGTPMEQTVRANVPHVTPLNMLDETPQWIDCPFCQHRTQTRIGKQGSPMQILAGFLCCLICVCFTCIPCLAGWCEDVDWFCSNCNQRVAARHSDGAIQVYGPTVPSQHAK